MTHRHIPAQKRRCRRSTFGIEATPKCDLTPLLDMTFVLTFLFLAMLFQRPSLTRLPIQLATVGGENVKAQTGPDSTAMDTPIVIQTNGTILLRQTVLSTEQFANFCRQLKSENNEATISIAIDRDTPHHAVATVLQILRKHGLNADLLTAPEGIPINPQETNR